MLKFESQSKEINYYLAWLTNYIHLNNGQGKYDINQDAENIYCGLLNIIFSDNPHHGFTGSEVNLRNLNEVKPNYPAIDLADADHHLAVQVTSSEEREKIRSTFAKFFKHQLHRKYHRLIFLMIGVKDAYSKAFAMEDGFDFNVDRDVWDIKRLGAEIDKLTAERKGMLLRYLKAQFDLHSDPAGQASPHLHLPPVSAIGDGFVGREKELRDIGSQLRGNVKPIVLSGLGGMGKTELAVRFGRDYKDGSVYFIRFDTSFTRTIAKMADGIRPKLSQEELARSDEELCAEVLEILENCGERDILIIDNVDADSGSLLDLMDDPAYEQLEKTDLRLILTTRFGHDRSLIDVKKLATPELFRIFSNHRATATEAEMTALIKSVNGHTLTIDQIARLLNGKGLRKVTPEMLLNALKNNTLPREKYRKIAMDYNQSKAQAQIYENLSIVFNVSGIPEEGKAVLRCATLLPADGMNSDYFLDALPEEEQEALETLVQHGWLNAEDGLLTIHPVIRLVCREELKPSDESCMDFLNGLWEQFDSKKHERDKFTQMAELFANATDTLEDAEAEWLNNCSRLWYELMQSQKAKALYEKHIPALEQRIPDHPSLAIAYGHMGISCDDLGDRQNALEYQLKALAIFEKILPADHLHLSTAYNNVGTTYGHLGNHQKALEYQLKALAIREKVLPPDHPSLATAYGNVGSTYNDLGYHQKALEFQLNALAIRKKVLPPDHPSLAISYSNVGLTYGDLGDYSKALEFKRNALAIREKVLPKDHPTLGTAYNNVGTSYGDLGDYNKALEFQLKALAIFEKVLPPDHPDLATTYDNVGITHSHLGDHQKALEFQLNALAIREKALPPDHPGLATSHNNVGNTYGDLGNHQKALEFQLNALAIREKVLSQDHPHLAISYNNVGVTYFHLREHPLALEYLEKALAIRESSLPAGHPDTESTRQSIKNLLTWM